MKWYKKQLDELKKKNPEVANLEHGPAKVEKKLSNTPSPSTKPFVHNPVKLRNVNRPKTDA